MDRLWDPQRQNGVKRASEKKINSVDSGLSLNKYVSTNRLNRVQESLLTVPNMLAGLTGFYTALWASAFKPKEGDKAQLRGGLEGWIGGGQGFPSSQREGTRVAGCLFLPSLLPLPGAGLLGRPAAFPLSIGQEGRGANTWPTAPGHPGLSSPRSC